MSEISVGSQIFDLVFHPSHATLYTASLSGKVNGIAYDSEGKHQQQFSIQISKKSCRTLSLNGDGTRLIVAGKGKGIFTIDTETSKVIESRVKAHETPINRSRYFQPHMFATGDDDGVIKLWDPRKKDSLRTYKHHFDYITDFLWLEDSKQLVSTSGDGTLSVLDVRSKKTEPFAHSEDQEDELLSLVAIKGGTKVVVGTQIGILSVFNRSSGWGDCVDRIPGHPHSVDALCSLPPSVPNVDTTSTILTGSSDGFLRAVNIFPTKLHGVVADHGEWPVERIAVGEASTQLTLNGDEHDDDDDSESAAAKKVGSEEAEDNEEEEDEPSVTGRWWAGSVGHDEVLKLTDLGLFFSKGSSAEDEEDADDDDNHGDSEAGDEKDSEAGGEEEDQAGEVDDSDEDAPEPNRKRKKRKDKDPMAVRKKKAKNEIEVEGAFFNDL